MKAKQNVLKLLQSLSLHPLALFEDIRHLLHVFGIVVVDILQGHLVGFATFVHLIFALANSILELFKLEAKGSADQNERPTITKKENCGRVSNPFISDTVKSQGK